MVELHFFYSGTDLFFSFIYNHRFSKSQKAFDTRPIIVKFRGVWRGASWPSIRVAPNRRCLTIIWQMSSFVYESRSNRRTKYVHASQLQTPGLSRLINRWKFIPHQVTSSIWLCTLLKCPVFTRIPTRLQPTCNHFAFSEQSLHP